MTGEFEVLHEGRQGKILGQFWVKEGGEPPEAVAMYTDDDGNDHAISDLLELRDMVAISSGLQCPVTECNNQGWYPQQVDDDEWEQVQCEFCCVVDDSIFNRRRKKMEEVLADG